MLRIMSNETAWVGNNVESYRGFIQYLPVILLQAKKKKKKKKRPYPGLGEGPQEMDDYIHPPP